MENNRDYIINIIKEKTGNACDIIYKNILINNKTITLIFSNSTSSQNDINEYILKKLNNKKIIPIKNIFKYLKNNIPNNNIKEIFTIKDALYFLFSGFTLIILEDGKMLSLENKAKRNSDISTCQNEVSIKGPNDSFCENYEANIGLLRRRIKSEKLWFNEVTLGSVSKTKVALFYLNDKADLNLVNKITAKIKNINIEYVGNTNYIIDKISNANRSIFPTTITTERPDLVCQMLMQGRIALICENTKDVVIMPCMFIDFFKKPDDYYEKSLNIVFNRIIRITAMFLAILIPSLYISLMAYNLEAIPSGLIVNFSIQKDGVPFSTVFEILVMNFLFQILRESDLRFPGKGGSSISIVGGLVLGEAAVEAGIVSPITIIIVGISSVASLAFSSIELIDSIRWWQLFFIIISSLFGFVGVVFGLIIMLTLLISEKSLGKPYLFPFEPFSFKGQKDAIISSDNVKFNPQNIYEDDNNE